jgi:hypothetical protein
LLSNCRKTAIGIVIFSGFSAKPLSFSSLKPVFVKLSIAHQTPSVNRNSNACSKLLILSNSARIRCLTTVSVGKATRREKDKSFSKAQIKQQYYNLNLLELFSKALGLDPITIKNQPKIKELLLSMSCDDRAVSFITNHCIRDLSTKSKY